MKNKSTLRKVRWKLTLICAGTTIFILLVMSFLLLSISQKNLNNTHFLSFQNNMAAFLATIEAQTVFSHKWLADVERVGKFQVQIKDNGNDFSLTARPKMRRKRFCLNMRNPIMTPATVPFSFRPPLTIRNFTLPMKKRLIMYVSPI